MRSKIIQDLNNGIRVDMEGLRFLLEENILNNIDNTKYINKAVVMLKISDYRLDEEIIDIIAKYSNLAKFNN